MKTYIMITFLVACLIACSHGFALKEVPSPLTKIVEVKKDFVTDAQGVVGELKESAKLKKQALVDSVKAVVKVKSGVASGIKAGVTGVKSTLLKGVQAVKNINVSALKAAKQTFINNYIDTKRSQMKNAVAAISAKTQGLFQHKLPIKETATTLFSGAVNKVHEGITKKTQFLSKIKTPIETRTVLLLPISQEPIKVHTYVSSEEPIIGKVFVQEAPVHGIPFNGYGPPANSYGPPADIYGPAV